MKENSTLVVKMNVFFIAQYYMPHIGGAEKSISYLLKSLSNKHNIKIIQMDYNIKSNEKNIKIVNIKIPSLYKLFSYHILKDPKFKYPLTSLYLETKIWEKLLDKYIKNKKPDLIITQLHYSSPTIRIANKYNIPSIIFLRSIDNICPDGRFIESYCGKEDIGKISLENKFRYIKLNKIIENNIESLKNSDLVISNSNFMRNYARRLTKIDSKVVYPSISKEEIKYNVDRDYITFIKPVPHKGVDIVLSLAKELENEKFLFIGNTKKHIKKQISKYQNIEYINWTDDIDSYYKMTKILLVPSLCYEAFGRVVIEAQKYAIPVIANNIGGINEAIGKGGILINDVHNIKEWIKAIDSLKNREIYKNLSVEALNNSRKFSDQNTYIRFTKVVKETLNIDL